jgi:hypothetical protein
MSTSCPRHDELVDALVSAAGLPDSMRDHLDTCAECHREWAELSGLPPLVRRGVGHLPETESAGRAAPDRELAELLGVIRRRRRGRILGAVGGSIAAVAAAVAIALPLSSAGGTKPAAQLAASSPDGVHLDVALRPKDWGTSLSVGVSGLPEGVICELVVEGRSGRQVAGWWWSAHGRVSDIGAATSLHLPQIRGVELLVDGRTVAGGALRSSGRGYEPDR